MSNAGINVWAVLRIERHGLLCAMERHLTLQNKNELLAAMLAIDQLAGIPGLDFN
jgi:hypothetical protein